MPMQFLWYMIYKKKKKLKTRLWKNMLLIFFPIFKITHITSDVIIWKTDKCLIIQVLYQNLIRRTNKPNSDTNAHVVAI